MGLEILLEVALEREGVFLLSRLANIHFYKSCRKSQLFVVELKKMDTQRSRRKQRVR